MTKNHTIKQTLKFVRKIIQILHVKFYDLSIFHSVVKFSTLDQIFCLSRKVITFFVANVQDSLKMFLGHLHQGLGFCDSRYDGVKSEKIFAGVKFYMKFQL